MAASSRTCCATPWRSMRPATSMCRRGGARPLLSPLRRRRGLDPRPSRVRRRVRRRRGDRPAHGRDPGGARGVAADPRPHRRLDLRQPARPQGLGADRPRRLPRSDARRRDDLGEAYQFPHQHRHRDRRRSRRTRRGSAPPRAETCGVTLEWEIRRIGRPARGPRVCRARELRDAARRRADGRLVAPSARSRW